MLQQHQCAGPVLQEMTNPKDHYSSSQRPCHGTQQAVVRLSHTGYTLYTLLASLSKDECPRNAPSCPTTGHCHVCYTNIIGLGRSHSAGGGAPSAVSTATIPSLSAVVYTCANVGMWCDVVTMPLMMSIVAAAAPYPYTTYRSIELVRCGGVQWHIVGSTHDDSKQQHQAAAYMCLDAAAAQVCCELNRKKN